MFSLAALVAIGSLLLQIPYASTRGGLSPSDATFTAVSALCVTGLSVITPSQDLTMFGQIILLLLIQIGGAGYMVLAVMAFQFIGKRITLTDRLALKVSLGLLSSQGLVQLTRQVFKTVLIIEAVGAVLLWLHWRRIMPEDKAVFYSIFHSVSSFCNAGFDLFSGTPEHMHGVPLDNLTLMILGLLIFLGGLGIPVLFDFGTWRERRQFSLHTRITVPLVLTLVIVGALGIYASEFFAEGALTRQPGDRAMVMSLFQSVSSRTAGYAGMPDFSNLAPATELVIVTLMFIGCAPASMGGGITTGTVAVLVLALAAYARGRDVAIFKGRAIPGEMVRKAAAVLTISIIVVGFATWLIAMTHRTTLDVAAFEVVSAFSTTGLTLGLTSNLNTFGRIVIMFMMFWGRLGALTIIVSLARTNSPRLARYPEERVLIG